MKTSVLIILLFLLFSVESEAKQVSYDFSSIEKGESTYSGELTSVMKDSSGYIWCHRNGNLLKFNGHKWETVLVPLGLGGRSNNITINASLVEDHYGNLWLGNKNGLYYYNILIGKIEVLSNDTSELRIPAGEIHDIIVYSDNEIFFIANNEPYRLKYSFEKETETFSVISISKAVQNSEPKYSLMTQSSNGDLWILSDKSATVYTPDENKFRTVEFEQDLKLKAHPIYRPVVHISTDDVIWIGTQGHGIKSYNTKTDLLKHYSAVEGKVIRLIKDIEEDKNGNIWTSTIEGLICIDGDSEKTDIKLVGTEKEYDDLYLEYITSMCYDEDGYILLVAQGGKMIKMETNDDKYDLLPINLNFNTSPNYSAYATTRISSKGDILKIRDCKKSSKIVSVNTKFRKETDYLIYTTPYDKILDFNFVGDHLWIGSAVTGLAVYDSKTKNHISTKKHQNILDLFKNKSVARIIKRSDSDLYIITLNGEIFNVIKDQYSKWNYNKIPTTIGFLALSAAPVLVDSKEWIWTASPLNILLGLEPHGKVQKLTMPDEEMICSLCESSDSTLLVGTYNGLFSVNVENENIVRLSDFDNISIFNIIKTGDNDFWLTSFEKIYHYNDLTNEINVVSHHNGLPECRFQANSAIKLDDGTLGFGTLRKGIMIFSPEKISFSYRQHVVKITGAKANGKLIVFNNKEVKNSILNAPYPYATELNLDYNHESISIQFSALDYSQGENVKYAYLLDGVDKKWNIVGADIREVNYSNLKPGKYFFRVKATGTLGVWNGKETVMSIDIKPVWFKTKEATFLSILFFFFLIFYFWKYTISKVKLKEQLKLEKSERDRDKETHQMKLRFFTNISHEFKTPLSLLIGPLKQLRTHGSTLSDQEKETLFDLMSRNMNHLMEMINQLMDFRKVENKAMKLHIRPVNISRFIEREFSRFKEEGESLEKTFLIESQLDKQLFCWVDADKLRRVLSNLLSNAIKYSSTNGIIQLYYRICDDGIEIKICDNGYGIDANNLPHIFERYYRVEDNEKSMQVSGTGIGLALSKELAEMMGGTLTAESTLGQGSCFRFWFPIGAAPFAQDEAEKKQEIKSDDTTIVEADDANADKIRKKPLVLVVEDNKDMQAFLKGILSNCFVVELANNGFEGIEKCDMLFPDLIVSDVMMPEMDGLEMVRRLKTNIRTSHLPIILLTAQSSPDHQVEGLETGADLYIAKPFDPAYLKVSINNLVESRIDLRKRFGKKLIDVTTAEITITKTDELFFDRITGIISKRLFDSEFKIEDIHHEVGMSRSQFFRKIKALTDQTAGEFVKSLRLKKAAELLKDGDMRVSDVCYEVGFTDPKYFGKVFRKHFDISPSQYRNSQEKEQ